MKVKILNNYSGIVKEVEAPSAPQMVNELLRLYPWLHNQEEKDLKALVARLNWSQALSAVLQEDPTPAPMAKSEPRNLEGNDSSVVHAMMGHDHHLQASMAAARFLSGGKEPQDPRQALWQADGDHALAALLAHGLEPSVHNLKALAAVAGITRPAGGTGKPPEALDPLPVEPGHPDADEAAEEIGRAFQDRVVMPVELGGKHSKGSMLARDYDTTHTWLLKPGSGGQTPAAGAKEDMSSQSRREAAFYHMADAWGLGDYYPEAELVIVNKKEYAAIRLLPWSFRTMDKLKDEDSAKARSILEKYLRAGVLHRWAVLDFVLGNPDRHAANLMVKDDIVKLIDHGSAMAGEAFDPAHDKYSFTPYYLRAWSDAPFSTLDAAAKLKLMPRLAPGGEGDFRSWVEGLRPTDLDKILQRYGVNPQAARERLAKLQAMAAIMPADLAINRLWVEV